MSSSTAARVLKEVKTFSSLSRRAFPRYYVATSRAMAVQQKIAGNVTSEIVKAEGGPERGSTSAQMQSEVAREQNFEQAAQEVIGKAQQASETISSGVCSISHPNSDDDN